MRVDITTSDDGSRLEVIDHGDGTGTEIHYDEHGVETHRVERTDLEIPQTTIERIDQWLSQRDLDDSAALIAVMEGITRTARTMGLSVEDLLERIAVLLTLDPALLAALEHLSPPTAQGGDQ